MERIKLAILKAREAADKQRQERPRAALGVSAALSAAAMGASPDRGVDHAGSRAEPRHLSRTLSVPLLVGLAAVVAFWAVKSDPGATPVSAAMEAVAAPVPQVAVVIPVQPAEPSFPADARSEPPASAGLPAFAAGKTEPAIPPAPSPDFQVVAAVEAWRQAWSKRDMTTYLGAYSDAFTPPDGVSREDWIASRYRKVGGRKSIDVQIQRLQVLTSSEGRARVSFLQDYTSGSIRELGQPKTLDLLRGADNRWRIVGEWQGDPPPPVAGAGKS